MVLFHRRLRHSYVVQRAAARLRLWAELNHRHASGEHLGVSGGEARTALERRRPTPGRPG